MLLWMVSMAWAADYKLADDATTTQRSGQTGNQEVELISSNAPNYHGIYEITVWAPDSEEGVCKIRMRSRHLNTHNSRMDKWEEPDVAGFDQCLNNANNQHAITFSGQETYVRGINVCLKQGIIHGVRLYGTRLNRSTGQLTRLEGNKEWKTPDCTNWQQVRYCPAGKVANSATLLIEETDPRVTMVAVQQPVGLKLGCRSIVAQ